jgi:acetyltransferase
MLVQEMVPPGKEVIIGIVRDPQFGPMVMFGLGGIFVEVLKDFSMRHAPLKERDAWEMIHEVRGIKILEGARGDERFDLESITQTLMAVPIWQRILRASFRRLISTLGGLSRKGARRWIALR